MALPTLGQTAKKELGNFYNLLFILIVSVIYYSISVLLINYRFLLATIFNPNSLSYKTDITYKLIVGAYYALGSLDFTLVVITSVLVAANFLILIKTLKGLRKGKGKLTLTVGGSTVLGVLVAGSCACGFSVLSLLGLTGALSFLPFEGVLIHILIISLLSFSLFYSLRTYHKEVVCKIKWTFYKLRPK